MARAIGDLRLFTGYFAGLGVRSGDAVSIDPCEPPSARRMERYLPLVPAWKMWTDHKYGRLSDGEYERQYRDRYLRHLDPVAVAFRLDRKVLATADGYADRKRTRLKCSHRHFVAAWLRESGISCEELPPP